MLVLQVKTTDTDHWLTLNQRSTYGDQAYMELEQLKLRWQTHYEPFKLAQFRIVKLGRRNKAPTDVETG